MGARESRAVRIAEALRPGGKAKEFRRARARTRDVDQRILFAGVHR